MNQKRRLWLIPLTVLTLTVALQAEAEIYKWVDENGQVHYGEQPVGDKAREVIIKLHGGTKSGATTAPVDHRIKRDKMLQAMEQDRHAREEEKQKKSKSVQKNKMRCIRAKDALKQYKSASSLYKLDTKGTRITMSDEQRKQATKQLQAKIKEHCK